jgi:hypothetical protein
VEVVVRRDGKKGLLPHPEIYYFYNYINVVIYLLNNLISLEVLI